MECIDAILGRRAVNFFDSTKDIDLEVLKDIINKAATAPSSYNIQPWEAVLVYTKENKQILKEICNNQPKVEQASADLIVIANPKAAIEHADDIVNSWLELGYITEGNKEAVKSAIVDSYGVKDNVIPEKAKLKAVRDSSLFAMNFMITARCFGFEAHPMDGFNDKRLRDFIKLPDYKIITMVIAIGYKDQNKKLLPRAFRYSFEDFVKLL
ncbi:nitroreductase [Hydrogenobaculum sp. Y04AAS1]|uniref:nitroreductase family protein n=1 Tax=Hydrogenobaculum sp. (strain Y04AAS1) TaxID=380749 RepID=UPI00015BDE9B|nr:nitroreductase [Hydrogenobaculum sp. Y04AAS1]HCT65998.1 nitroreductase family protein [Hydrogenobaculum sp.]